MQQAQQPPVFAATLARILFPNNSLVRFVRLRTADELRWYQHQYFSQSGSQPSLKYLFQARVYVALYQEQIIGGFVINADFPLRYLEPFSEVHLKSFEEKFGFRESDTAEISCIWLEPTKKKASARLQVYAASLWMALWAGKKNVLGGAKYESIINLYRQVLDIDIFAGTVTDQSGEGFTSFLCYQTRWNVVRNTFRWIYREMTGKAIKTKEKKQQILLKKQ